MIVDKLQLKNYRNYDELDVEFSEKTNIFYGNNAQGKTNILESIYVCSTTKSHRGSTDKDIINFNNSEAHIKMIVKKRSVPFRIDMHLKRNRPKGVAINGIPIHKSSELFGIVNVVFFSPEDLDIIKGSPVNRRKFIDLELCQLDKIYVSNLVNYNKCLMQRNKLLKNIFFGNGSIDTLEIWDMQLAKYGELMIKRRIDFINDLNEIIQFIHSNLTNGKENMEIKYEPSVECGKLYEALVNSRERDIKSKFTTCGPHRDDISFYNKEINLKIYGSQGQQRTAALSLKLSEIELVKKVTNDTPVLLLDDVLSELDNDRQMHLLDSLEGIQTFITCTGLDEFVRNQFKINKVFKVVDGKIEDSL